MGRSIKVWFADLTHTGVGINADVFPLGVGLVAAYAQQQLRDQIDISLFKFPSDLDRALRRSQPQVMCFANYVWNARLTYKFAEHIKRSFPGVVIVYGGPDFPIPRDEREEYLATRPAVDFYIKWDGEHAFHALLQSLMDHGFDTARMKSIGVSGPNVCYLEGDRYVEGPDQRVENLMTVPSPYLMGLMDEFFDHPIMPAIETIRGCPYFCTFCNDGSPLRSKIYKKTTDFVRDELEYIAARATKSNQLVIVDLNFGMYQEDLETANVITDLRARYSWPDRIQGSMGKSQPSRLLEVTNRINAGNAGVIKLGSSLQSTDAHVLTVIKRKNLSIPQLLEMRRDKRSHSNLQDYTELIIPLPGETVTKHMQSLRDVVDVLQMNNVDVHQLTMLRGSEMAIRSQRKEFGFDIRHRLFVGCLGVYEIGEETTACAEVEEMVVATSTMSFEDYLECRVMDFLVKVFIDNDPFKEVFGIVRHLNMSCFDILLWMKDHALRDFAGLANVCAEFVARTQQPMRRTEREVDSYASRETIEAIMAGRHAQNEMLSCRVLAFRDHFAELAEALAQSATAYMADRGALTPDIERYLGEAKRLCELRRFDFVNYDSTKEAEFDFDFVAAEQAAFVVAPTAFRKRTRIRCYYDEPDLHYIGRQIERWGAGNLHAWGKFLQKSNALRTRRKIEALA